MLSLGWLSVRQRCVFHAYVHILVPATVICAFLVPQIRYIYSIPSSLFHMEYPFPPFDNLHKHRLNSSTASISFTNTSSICAIGDLRTTGCFILSLLPLSWLVYTCPFNNSFAPGTAKPVRRSRCINHGMASWSQLYHWRVMFCLVGGRQFTSTMETSNTGSW